MARVSDDASGLEALLVQALATSDALDLALVGVRVAAALDALRNDAYHCEGRWAQAVGARPRGLN